MRRVLLVALLATGTVALTGCPPKIKPGECKSSEDCAKQSGFGKVCVQGRCQECGADGDCKAGFTCSNNACVPKPQCDQNTPCPAGQLCQAGACVRDPNACAGDADCGAGKACQAGQCVTAQKTCSGDAQCGTGERCQNGACVAVVVPPGCGDAGAFTIRFGFDKSDITDASKPTLQKLAECLKAAPARKFGIAGHADERGATQYNLALGERRAEAARKYLSDLGSGGDANVVSYGEEKPVCQEKTEACWEQNRRVEFSIER